MSRKPRKQYSAQEKVAILREHLLGVEKGTQLVVRVGVNSSCIPVSTPWKPHIIMEAELPQLKCYGPDINLTIKQIRAKTNK
jgi:hypothetical protein